MKNQFLVILAILIMCSFVKSQNNESTIEVIPLSYVMPVIVSQPNCPIQVEKFIVGKESSGKIKTFYKIYNTSEKAVKSYKIARWYSDNTGFIGYGALPIDNAMLMPKQKIETFSDRLLVYTNSDKKQKKMKKIAFIMIIEVNFDDGSKYIDEESFLSLKTHLEESFK